MVLFKFIDPIRTMRTEVMCANCGTMETPAWRFSKNGKKVFNACRYKSNYHLLSYCILFYK